MYTVKSRGRLSHRITTLSCVTVTLFLHKGLKGVWKTRQCCTTGRGYATSDSAVCHVIRFQPINYECAYVIIMSCAVRHVTLEIVKRLTVCWPMTSSLDLSLAGRNPRPVWSISNRSLYSRRLCLYAKCNAMAILCPSICLSHARVVMRVRLVWEIVWHRWTTMAWPTDITHSLCVCLQLQRQCLHDHAAATCLSRHVIVQSPTHHSTDDFFHTQRVSRRSKNFRHKQADSSHADWRSLQHASSPLWTKPVPNTRNSMH